MAPRYVDWSWAWGSRHLTLLKDEYAFVDVGQHIFSLAYGGELSFAPTSSFNRVLDVGAGSGKWAMDMGV